MMLYLRVTRPINAIGRFGPPVFGVVMLAIQGYVFFGPPPASPAAAAVTALVSYVVFAAVPNGSLVSVTRPPPDMHVQRMSNNALDAEAVTLVVLFPRSAILSARSSRGIP